MLTIPQDDGAALLEEARDLIRRFVVLADAQSVVCVLWAVHTHAIDAAQFTPYLHIHSPVLRSGKTRLLEVPRLLVRKPWFTGRVTSSVLVRKVSRDQPTVLLDESDAAFQTRGDYGEVLRGILNTGFERDGSYSMCVQAKKDWEPRDFGTFSPKAIAGIGQLPTTIRDRSIPIQLKRAFREDKQRFRKAKVQPEAEQLRQRIEEWAQTNLDTLREAQPGLPDELNDRQQDVCECLIAIADIAGGDWPARARASLIELCTGTLVPDDSPNLRLLGDIRDVFIREGVDKLPTHGLLAYLRDLGESPWCEFDRGRPLSSYGLSKLVRSFDVRPRDIRFEQGVQKGYLRASFEDSWRRYLDYPLEPDQEGQQGQQGNVYASASHFSAGQQESTVADGKDENSSIDMRVVAGVAPSQPLWGELGAVGTSNAGPKTKGAKPCRVHPKNKIEWWQSPSGDRVCGVCHPNPRAT